MSATLVLAVPAKGRLQENAEAFFARAGLALVKPRVIVVLGRIAAQTLLQTQTPVSKLRGKVHEVEGVPVVVTYHPAYLLRTLTDKARAWEDLCLARKVYAEHGGK